LFERLVVSVGVNAPGERFDADKFSEAVRRRTEA
jgi:hypothetical protein